MAKRLHDEPVTLNIVVNGKRKCGAKRVNSEERCMMPAGYRTIHRGYGSCSRHGGNTKNGVLSAMKQKAYELSQTYGAPRIVDPHTALIEEVWRTAGHVEWLGERIREMRTEDLIWGITRETVEGAPAPYEEIPIAANSSGEEIRGSISIRKVESQAVPHIWLQLYQEERKRLVDACRVAIACGIAERAVKIAEDQGKMIARIISGALGEIGVDQNDERVRVAVRNQLMLLASGGVDAP